MLDRRWADVVGSACDPVFAAADLGFVRVPEPQATLDLPAQSLLWEADPHRFAARFPAIVDSYGAEQWPGVTCIDWWIYVDAERRRCRLSVEGPSVPELHFEVTGVAEADGKRIAVLMALLLQVPTATAGR